MKFIRKPLFLVLTFFTILNCFGQYGMRYVNIDKVKNTELIVIVDHSDKRNEGIDEPLANAFKKIWTYNPYKIVDQKEVEENISQYKDNPKYSFLLIRYHNNPIRFPAPYASTNRQFMITFSINNNGAGGIIPPLTAMACSEILDTLLYYTPEAEFIKNLWILQDQMSRKFVYAPDKIIAEKTLLIPQSIMRKKTEKDLSFYPYKFRIASKEEISTAILNQTPDIVVIEATIYPQGCATVFDVSTGKILYQGTALGINGYFERTIEALKNKLAKAK